MENIMRKRSESGQRMIKKSAFLLSSKHFCLQKILLEMIKTVSVIIACS
jgi:hypothetical protein